MEGGGKVAYSYGGGGHHHDTKLLKSFSSVEKFGLGLFAGLLIVACAYFSTAKFDAVHIAMSKQPSKPQACNNLFERAPSVTLLHLPLARLANCSNLSHFCVCARSKLLGQECCRV
jgi:hypothetical protein